MKNQLTRILAISLLATLGLVSAPVGSPAAEKNASPEVVQKTKRSDRAPFQGKVYAVDKAAMTITLDGKERKRIIHLTSQTRIMKAGKPASLDDVVVGEEIGGQILKTSEGEEEAISLRLGPKPKEEATSKAGRKETVQGMK